MELNKKIILFDGVCNLCNSSVQLVIKHDKNDEYRFATLQSNVGMKMASERHIDTSEVDSIILIKPGIAYYTKSVAALKIGKSFGGFWFLLVVFEWIPEKITNRLYDYIVKNRYKWYGKKDSCMIPTPELKSKFLE
tara:strand:+ start:4822 stop:5229 length:408 start_codon:yes stop_codon:yes gene_type:complete